MVNLQGKKTTTSREIKDALSSNLNITADDSRFKTIVNKIADSRYRIKNLSTITDTISIYKTAIIDGKMFSLPNIANAGTIEVRDYQSNNLLKTITDGANAETTAICCDANYIYISKCVQRITDKNYKDIYVRKYNRCTLELVSESPILYTGITTTAVNWSNVFAIVENGEYLYLACVQSMQMTGDSHKIRKIKKSDFSSVSEIAWFLPLNMIKHENGFFVAGGNTTLSSDNKYKRIDSLDWDLNVVQTFPQTTLTKAYFRYAFYKGDYLYACNDSGVLAKYQISTNSIVAETQIAEAGLILNIVLINDNYILLQTKTAKIMLYDLNLTFIKMWNFYNTTTTGGYVLNDNNNTIWTQSASQPNTIHKKQFIDMTKDII